MAEPMDLSDESIVRAIGDLLRSQKLLGPGTPQGAAWDRMSAWTQLCLAIRDAATAAERKRAIAIVDEALTGLRLG